MLYGVRRELQEQLAADGFRVSIYVPFGSSWYPYLMRRMAERHPVIRDVRGLGLMIVRRILELKVRTRAARHPIVSLDSLAVASVDDLHRALTEDRIGSFITLADGKLTRMDTFVGDQTALEALVRFTDEELKHQELFRRLAEVFRVAGGVRIAGESASGSGGASLFVLVGPQPRRPDRGLLARPP